ncbi:unnamed protein product [Cuscuta campestris]|uniref:Uncharacterized protein n=1 Tax=Cuscuta campestris TaxID=132261 RepID=A0A484N046_9ASTE|nr:unnamed protein product [Cuscuta campestris]
MPGEVNFVVDRNLTLVTMILNGVAKKDTWREDAFEFVMKGEKEFIEKILNTEINFFRAIRDGSALMQHMEDFYYITLLENVRSNCQNVTITSRVAVIMVASGAEMDRFGNRRCTFFIKAGIWVYHCAPLVGWT